MNPYAWQRKCTHFVVHKNRFLDLMASAMCHSASGTHCSQILVQKEICNLRHFSSQAFKSSLDVTICAVLQYCNRKK